MNGKTPFCALFAASLLSALMVVGCGEGGPKLVKAGGTVKYKSAALSGASIVFVPDEGGQPAIGHTDDQGRFTLVTSGRSGAALGAYKVSITAVRQKRAVSEEEAAAMSSEAIAANHETLIPVKYNNLVTSGLTATVGEDASKNEFGFDLQ